MTHLSPQQLSAHLDCALNGASLQAVETHLEACERCRDELAALTLQDQMLAEALRGETDRELFDLIGLRVQSIVHPQRARALEKSIAELERIRDERRRQAESVARRVTEQRQQPPSVEPQTIQPSAPVQPLERAPMPPHESTRSHESTPTPHPAPAHPAEGAPMPPASEAASGVESEAHAGPAADPRRRALGEARVRAEAEARAFALESDRARDEAERRVLEQAASRARQEAAAGRKAEEEGRARAANSARAEAQRLANAAEAARADAETSARDALSAQARAETRAAAAEEARRQARRKADEARRLEADMAGRTERGTRAAENSIEDAPEPATLRAQEVAAVRDAPLDPSEDEPATRHSRPRRLPEPARDHAGSQRSRGFTLVALMAILLVTLWFSIGRQWLRDQSQQLPASSSLQAPAAGGAGGSPVASPPAAPESVAPAVSSPPPTASEDSHKPRHAVSEPAKRSETASPVPAPGGSGQATVVEETHTASVTEAEPDDQTPGDLGLLCGMVRDEDNHPIAGARVMMADVGVVVVTDRVGRFCLTAPRGVRTLSVIALGFGTHRETVSVGHRTGELSVTLRTANPTPRSPSR